MLSSTSATTSNVGRSAKHPEAVAISRGVPRFYKGRCCLALAPPAWLLKAKDPRFLTGSTASSLTLSTRNESQRTSAPMLFCFAGSRSTSGAIGAWWPSGSKRSWESWCRKWTTSAPSRSPSASGPRSGTRNGPLVRNCRCCFERRSSKLDAGPCGRKCRFIPCPPDQSNRLRGDLRRLLHLIHEPVSCRSGRYVPAMPVSWPVAGEPHHSRLRVRLAVGVIGYGPHAGRTRTKLTDSGWLQAAASVRFVRGPTQGPRSMIPKGSLNGGRPGTARPATPCCYSVWRQLPTWPFLAQTAVLRMSTGTSISSARPAGARSLAPAWRRTTVVTLVRTRMSQRLW